MARHLQPSSIAFLALLLALQANISTAQSPRLPGNNVDLVRPTETNGSQGFAIFVSQSQIIAAFNKGRRSEESQFGFPANSLGTFSLPANYESLTAPQRGLYIINAERRARAGMDYGDGPVLGKPLEGEDVNLTNVAQDHAEYMDSTEIFSNIGRNGSTPLERIRGAYGTGCLQNLGVGQANAMMGGKYALEEAIFTWLYRDVAGYGVERMTLLIQNKGIGPPNFPTLSGYVDNHGAPGSEGILGIGISGRYIVLNVADPSNAAGCSFSLVGNPLPVHLISWQGKYLEGAVKLNWETAWEENAAYFQVQRSSDLKTFANIAKLSAKGTTHEQQTYEWMDNAPAPGINYYRLIQTDLDGAAETSRIIAIRNELTSGNMTAYPNPVRPDEGFRFKNAGHTPESIQLFNLAGHELPVFTSIESDGEVRVKPAAVLTAGMYSLVVIENGQKRVSRVFVR